ncbi:unnamed protein product [Scytosiphon promiscuus]
MRLVDLFAALCLGTVVLAESVREPVGDRVARRAVPALAFANGTGINAGKEYSLDTREDVPAAGKECTPSPLWAKKVDPAKYDMGCHEIEELLQGSKTFAGRGNVREVYLAEYRGRSVALKLLIEESEHGRHQHLVELAAMDAVKGQPHVVDMLGFCGSTVVTEAYFKNAKRASLKLKEPLPMETVLSISLDAAQGLQSLHEAVDGPIVHFDIKASQLLIDEDGGVKLADFNLSYFMGKNPDGSPCQFNKKEKHRDLSWRKSSEYVSGKPLTEKVDIYRMGVVYASIIAAGRGTVSPSKAGGAISLDPAWHEGYVKVVQEMLADEAKQRPSAGAIASRLEAMKQELLLHTR